MIDYTLRLIRTSLRSATASKLDYLDESVLTLRVLPSDLDSFGHMNNGRYLTIMDLGRNDLLIRSGAIRIWLERRWTPLLGGALIRYRRPLQPLRRYELRTRVLCWDEKWFFFRQRFTSQGEEHAVALVKGLLRGPEGKVAPAAIPLSLGRSAISPPMPAAVRSWLEAEATLATS